MTFVWLTGFNYIPIPKLQNQFFLTDRLCLLLLFCQKQSYWLRHILENLGFVISELVVGSSEKYELE